MGAEAQPVWLLPNNSMRVLGGGWGGSFAVSRSSWSYSTISPSPCMTGRGRCLLGGIARGDVASGAVGSSMAAAQGLES